MTIYKSIMGFTAMSFKLLNVPYTVRIYSKYSKGVQLCIGYTHSAWWWKKITVGVQHPFFLIETQPLI